MGLRALFNPSEYRADNVGFINRLFIDDSAFEMQRDNNALAQSVNSRQLAEGLIDRERYNTVNRINQQGQLPNILTWPEFNPQSQLFQPYVDAYNSVKNTGTDLARTTAKTTLWVIVALVSVFLLTVFIATRKGVSIS